MNTSYGARTTALSAATSAPSKSLSAFAQSNIDFVFEHVCFRVVKWTFRIGCPCPLMTQSGPAPFSKSR